ncbi:hypothetical protein [Nonomuraea dietziae]|uniref:hypothetical protein n=1 Tax=Nonomuraea dietziae TaxID=65515 RepID=UPI0033D9128E
MSGSTWNTRAFAHEVRSMGTEAFYTTAAQVLPTLLIAVTLEVSLVFQARMRVVERINESAPAGLVEHYKWFAQLPPMQQSAWRWALASSTRWVWAAALLGLVFLVGEVLALLALGFRWFTPLTFFGTGSSLLILILTVVWVPVQRLFNS